MSTTSSSHLTLLQSPTMFFLCKGTCRFHFSCQSKATDDSLDVRCEFSTIKALAWLPERTIVPSHPSKEFTTKFGKALTDDAHISEKQWRHSTYPSLWQCPGHHGKLLVKAESSSLTSNAGSWTSSPNACRLPWSYTAKGKRCSSRRTTSTLQHMTKTHLINASSLQIQPPNR